MIGPVLLFLSGATALVYEVLWLRQLGLLFGSTALSAAICLSVFFAGMSLGQELAARHCSRLDSPLRVYGVIECCAGLSTLFALALPGLYVAASAALLGGDIASGGSSQVMRGILAATILIPPSALLGATFPIMVEAEVRRTGTLAVTATALYAANTLGGVAGAVAAPFWLLPRLGFRGTYVAAVAVNLVLAATALVAAARRGPGVARSRPRRPGRAPSLRLTGIAFASGALALAIEVLWTRMFAQVLHNSVYSFAAVLAVMLLALAMGGFLVHVFLRLRSRSGVNYFAALAILSGLAVAASALVFSDRTDGLAYLGAADGWKGYVGDVFALSAVVMLVPGTLLGTLFPFLLEAGERVGRGVPGATVGRLVSANTLGAVIGSLAAGFYLLPHFGLWISVQVVAGAYVCLALVIAPAGPTLLAIALGLAVLLGPLDPGQLGRVDLDPVHDELLEVRDTAAGTVAAVRRGELVSIRLNNSYTVGTSDNIANDRRKADLPLLLQARPRSVFFLGMGAGITAAAALDHPVEKVTTCELVPAIAEFASQYLAKDTHSLFDDARSRVVIADGRNALATTDERFDVIVGDLFVPWHSGTSNLYSREHFSTVAEHLTDNGIFAQWLPLYQFSRREFEIVARTMLDVFPLVTMWRGDLHPKTPAVALFGHMKVEPLDLAKVLANVRRRIGEHEARDAVSEALTLLFYAGNITQSRALFENRPINTDDRPVLEYLAPITQRQVKSGAANWLTSRRLVRLYHQLAAVTPAETDGYLARLDRRQLDYQRAGLDLYESFVARYESDPAAARRAFQSFRTRAPSEVVAMFEALMSAPSD